MCVCVYGNPMQCSKLSSKRLSETIYNGILNRESIYCLLVFFSSFSSSIDKLHLELNNESMLNSNNQILLYCIDNRQNVLINLIIYHYFFFLAYLLYHFVVLFLFVVFKNICSLFVIVYSLEGIIIEQMFL